MSEIGESHLKASQVNLNQKTKVSQDLKSRSTSLSLEARLIIQDLPLLHMFSLVMGLRVGVQVPQYG